MRQSRILRALALWAASGAFALAERLTAWVLPPIAGGLDTEFTTNATEAVKRWVSLLVMEMPREIYWNKFSGEDANSIIQIQRDLEKQAGDQLTYTLMRKLSGSGVSGDADLEGQEEQLSWASDAVTIDQRRNAVRLKGRMSERRTAFNQRNAAKDQLKVWMAETIDDDIFSKLATSTAATRILYGGNATAVSNLDSGDTVTPALFDKAIAKAKKASPKIWPTRVEGLDLYLILLHTDVAYDLRQNSTWTTAQQNANVRGRDNPQFLGAIGFWGGGAVIHEHEKVPVATDGGSDGAQPYASNFFCGRQAALLAWGARPEGWEKEFDYSAKTGFAVGAIWGVKKAVYSNVDHAFFELRTYRTNN